MQWVSVLAVTFGDAESVVAAGHKVIERHEEVGVALGRPQQVLLGAPAHRLGQRGRVQAEGPVQSFWRKTRGRGRTGRQRRKQSETDGRKETLTNRHTRSFKAIYQKNKNL